MAYTPREIKDRVAVGDDIFIVENLGDNRIRLIPAPTHVSEPGTPVNKALLQAIEDELGNLSTTKVDKVSGKGLSTNDFTDALKNKLDGIEAGAQKNSAITKAEIESKLELNDLLTTHKSTVVGAINELFTDVGNGKTLIAGAITDRGVPTNPSDTFSTMAENIRELSKLIEKNSDVLFIGDSRDYGGDINALTSDDNYIYVGGSTDRTVKKLDKSNLSVVATSPGYGGTIYALTSDDNYVYVGGVGARVKKLNKSDLSVVATSPDYGGNIYALTSDDNYVYVGGGDRRVKKLNKSNLSVVATSPDYGGIIYALTSDDNYVYVGGEINRTVKKLNKSDLSVVATSPDYGGVIRALMSDDNYVYVGGDIDRTVKKLDKSNLSVVATSPDYGGIIYALTSDDNYVYVGGSAYTVKKLNKPDLSVVATSPDYGGDINALTSDDNYIYVGGSTDHRVKKLIKLVYELDGIDYIRV
jgi:hypothetical protein